MSRNRDYMDHISSWMDGEGIRYRIDRIGGKHLKVIITLSDGSEMKMGCSRSPSDRKSWHLKISEIRNTMRSREESIACRQSLIHQSSNVTPLHTSRQTAGKGGKRMNFRDSS